MITHIDSASLHSVVSGIQSGRIKDVSTWEMTSLAEVTLSLLFKTNVFISPPPKLGKNLVHSDVDYITTILHSFIRTNEINQTQRKAQIELLKDWIKTNSNAILTSFKALSKDPSYDHFIRGSISKSWPYHISRLGSLIDKATFEDVADIFDWTKKDRVIIKKHSEDLDHIRLISERYNLDGTLPSNDLIQGYMLSALIRGKYYYGLQTDSNKKFILHPFRNYIIDPVREIVRVEYCEESFVEKFLAGLICFGAMYEDSDKEAILAWAKNVNKISSKTVRIPQISELDKAVSSAVQIAKKCDIEIKWPLIEKILDRTNEYFIIPLFGIATGLIAFSSTESHNLSLLSHSVIETTLRPYAKMLENSMTRSLANSKYHFENLAREGFHRMFALSIDDKNNLIKK